MLMNRTSRHFGGTLTGTHRANSGEGRRNTSRPPGHSRRAASGIHRWGSHHSEAPYSLIAKPKLWSWNGTRSALASTSGKSTPNWACIAAGGGQLLAGDVEPDRASARSRQPRRHIAGTAAQLGRGHAGYVVGKHRRLRLWGRPGVAHS